MVSMEEPENNFLQLGKGGMDDPSGGTPAPRPSLLFALCILFKIGSVFEPSLQIKITLVAAI